MSDTSARRRRRLASLLVALAAVLTGDPPGKHAAIAAEELPTTSRGKPAVVSVVANTTTVPRFEKFELAIALSATYDNPFDPDQIDLSAEFVAPSGKKVSVPGFFYQAYRNRNEGDDAKRPQLDAVGNPHWRIRFTPTETGRYTYVVRLENRIGSGREKATWGPASFPCAASARHGFLRVSPVNRRYFQYDDGTPFFVVGQNLQNDWPYYSHFRPLAASGCDAVRVWTFCHWTWLEWSPRSDIRWAKQGDWMRSYAGAGKYNQRIAWIADHHLAQSERDGLRWMLCLGNGTGGGELSKGGGYGSWDGHPYNVANGGFLDEPEKFWTDPRAKGLYKQRLRYIIARYSYSPSVWAWELWNEIAEARPEIAAWHREMADYIHQFDPNRHLVTTSTWQSPDRFRAIWNLPEIDFTQTHNYQDADCIHRLVGQVLRDHPDKPHIVGEGGGPPPRREPKSQGKKAGSDLGQIEFHNSLWSAALSGAAGATLPWWWKDRIEPQNLFFHYTALSRFAEDEPWASAKLSPVKSPRVWLAAEQGKRRLSPVLIVPTGFRWGAKTPRNRFTVEPDGSVPHVEDLPATLFGNKRSEWRNPPLLSVRYPAAGRFTVHVSTAVSGILEIVLDGKPALREKLPTPSNQEVDKDFSIDVPAGSHQIELRNAGANSVKIAHLLLTNYRDAARYPDLDLYGVQSDQSALLWIHHRLNTLVFRAAGFPPQLIAGANAEIGGLADGTYRVEWWDTYTGEITKTEQRVSQGGRLELDLPAVQTDLAAKIERDHAP